MSIRSEQFEKVKQSILTIIILVNFGVLPIFEYIKALTGINPLKRHVIVIIFIALYGAIYFIYNFDKIRVKIRIEFLTMAMCILLQVLWMPLAIGYGDEGVYDYIRVVANTGFSSLLMYLIGGGFQKVKDILLKPKVKLIINILFLIFVALIFYGVTLNPYGEFQIYYGKVKSDYLYIGDSFAIFSFLVLYVNKSDAIKILMAGIATLTLYVISSRLSFAAFVVVIIIDIGIRLINRIMTAHRRISKGKFFLVAAFLMGIMIFVSLSGGLEINFDNLDNNRVFGGLTDIKHDESYLSREKLLTLGENTLKENFILGKFMYEVEIMGGTGGYVHNIISYLVEYGIIFFCFFIGSILKKMGEFIVLYSRTRLKDSYDVVKFSIFLFTLMSIVIGRSYIYPFIWIPIGMMGVSKYSKYNK